MYALGHQLFAGAAVAANQHRGIAGRKLACQAAHTLGGRAAAQVVFNAPAHTSTALALIGTQVAVSTLNDGRVAANDQGAGQHAVFHNWPTPHDQRAHGQLHHVFTPFFTGQGPAHTQGRCHLLQQSAVQLLHRGAEQIGHARVQRADAALLIHGQHTVLQLAQHRLQPLVAIALSAAVAGQQQGIAERLAHRRI